jgi:hypothetical protein
VLALLAFFVDFLRPLRLVMHGYPGQDASFQTPPEQLAGAWNIWKPQPGLMTPDEQKPDIWRGVPIFYTATPEDLKAMIPDPMPMPPPHDVHGKTPGAEGVSPPMPWRLMGGPGGRDIPLAPNQLTCDTLGSKFFDELLYCDGESTSASSGDKENSAQETSSEPMAGEIIGAKIPFGAEFIRHGHDDVHTLMIKNIPCRCSQQEVLDAIVEIGFGDLYNFFYLPIRRGHQQNFGYAFIGFMDKEITKQFGSAMTGYRFVNRNSSKACAVAPARIQGFSSNVEHFQKMCCTRRKNQSTLAMCI